MNELIKKYSEKNLIIKKGSCYYFNNKNIGANEKAEQNIKNLISTGKLPEFNEESSLMPITKEDKSIKPTINPELSKKEEPSESLNEIYSKLSSGIGDIETRKKGGRFKVYVFGVDSRLENHPVIKKCPYVFRHNDKKRNVRSGNSLFNEGWTVLSKKLIDNDPRTKKKWLTVARDDTPDSDMFTIGDYVLCYADKGQYTRKKGKMNMENMLKSGAIADARQENAEKMATLSKDDPKQSMNGYMNANKTDQSIAKEQLENNKKFTSNEAQEYIDNLNSLGTKTSDINAEVEKMRNLVDSGKVGKTVKSAKRLKIDEV